MNHKPERIHKGRLYASIIGLVFVANMLLNAVMIFLNYPTESHRTVARHMEAFTTQMMKGEDYSEIMNSQEYIYVSSSPEANYLDIASFALLGLSVLVTTVILGTIYYYLRRHRTTSRPVLATALLASAGGLIPLILAAYGTAWFVGMQLPGIGHIVFMLFIGLVMGPLVNALITRIFEWHYNRKNSFVIE